MWVFVARDLTPGEPAREANEEIENLVVTWDEALAMIDRGEIQDGKTMVALLMLNACGEDAKRDERLVGDLIAPDADA